jgi:hypothetical protein
MFKKTNGPAKFQGKQEAPKSTAKQNPAKLIGNLTASKKMEDGTYGREEIAVLFTDDGINFRAVGKKGTEFEGVNFYINLSDKAKTVQIVNA